jgi:hypothetical protein
MTAPAEFHIVIARQHITEAARLMRRAARHTPDAAETFPEENGIRETTLTIANHMADGATSLTELLLYLDPPS